MLESDSVNGGPCVSISLVNFEFQFRFYSQFVLIFFLCNMDLANKARFNTIVRVTRSQLLVSKNHSACSQNELRANA